MSEVYPRVCGGTYLELAAKGKDGGLSPRVRGNREGAWQGVQDYGSIPACAGEPRRKSCCVSPSRVYPRVCGGTGVRPFPSNNSTGLSPRVRGNLQAIR